MLEPVSVVYDSSNEIIDHLSDLSPMYTGGMKESVWSVVGIISSLAMAIPVFEVQAYCNQFVVSVGFFGAKNYAALKN